MNRCSTFILLLLAAFPEIFFLTSHILLLTNITDIHTHSPKSLSSCGWSLFMTILLLCFIVIFMKGRRIMSHILLNVSYTATCRCTWTFTVLNKMLCCNVLQDSQQRIVVMKKESERLSQEVNQMDTNKLGKLNLLLNTNLKSLVPVASWACTLLHYFALLQITQSSTLHITWLQVWEENHVQPVGFSLLFFSFFWLHCTVDVHSKWILLCAWLVLQL